PAALGITVDPECLYKTAVHGSSGKRTPPTSGSDRRQTNCNQNHDRSENFSEQSRAPAISTPPRRPHGDKSDMQKRKDARRYNDQPMFVARRAGAGSKCRKR